jgi:arylsulfatase A-like enzyme
LERRIVAAPRQPFFWFVNLVECHSPYLPPRPYRGVSTFDRVRAAEDARRYYTLRAIWRACGGAFQVPDETLDRARRLYRASIAYMDAWIGRLVERLDTASLLDDTLVIVTADHGENFGENGLIAHGLSLDERLIGVPMVAAGPGSDSLPLASLAEVPRCLAEVAGIEDHPWHDGPPAGIGVAQSDPPGDRDDPKVRAGLAQLGLDDDPRGRLTTQLTCAVSNGLKLLRRGEREEVYDLVADPTELNPLSPDQLDADGAGQLAALRRALDHPSMAVRTPESLGVPAEVPVPSADVDDLEQRMKLLGYM